MTGSRSYLSNVVSVVALLILSLLVFTGASSKPRIIAIGDVHGAFDAFVDILQKSQVIDDKQKWVAENTILVQTGDILDRGPDSRKVMDLLMSLEKQAPQKKSEVISLLGNHEVMNMLGDLRYVSAEEFASYSDVNSQKKLDAAYLAYKEVLKQEAGRLGAQLPAVGNESDETWKAQHPPGFVEHREAFSRNGKYGKWLRKLEAIKVIDGNVFLHGGISPSIKGLTLAEINRRIHKELEVFDACHESLLNKKLILPVSTIDEILKAAKDELAMMEQKNQKQDVSLKECLELNRWLIRHPEGPLWFRGFDTWSDADGAANISSILETFRASHFITGHSVQAGGQIRTRFGGQLFLIDTGMLSSQYAGGRASALEYRNGKFTAIYPDGRKEFDQ